MRIAEINFGGDIGTRPAVVLKSTNNCYEVVKITTKAKANEGLNKYRLSGFSGVKGYVLCSTVYTVPKSKIKRFTNKLFKCEDKGILKNMAICNQKGWTRHIEIKG